MKYGLTFLGAAAAALIVSACGSDKVDVDTPGGTGTATSTGAGEGGMGGSGGAGGEGGAGGAPNCVKCSAVLLSGADPSMLCPGKSQMLAQALFQCTCVDKCQMQCVNECSMNGTTPTCQPCVQAQCSQQALACINDT